MTDHARPRQPRHASPRPALPCAATPRQPRHAVPRLARACPAMHCHDSHAAPCQTTSRHVSPDLAATATPHLAIACLAVTHRTSTALPNQDSRRPAFPDPTGPCLPRHDPRQPVVATDSAHRDVKPLPVRPLPDRAPLARTSSAAGRSQTGMHRIDSTTTATQPTPHDKAQ